MDQARRDALQTILAESEGLLRLAAANKRDTLVSLLRDVVRAAKANLEDDRPAAPHRSVGALGRSGR